MIFVAPISKDTYPAILHAFFPTQCPASANSSYTTVVSVSAMLVSATSRPNAKDTATHRGGRTHLMINMFLSDIMPEGRGRQG